MPKVRIMSDLHLEFAPLVLEPAGEDVIVLAGDIGIETDGVAWADKLSQKFGIPVVIIAGNHEFYRDTKHPHNRLYETLDACHEAAKGTNVTFLENETAIVAGVRFIGGTLWTDFELSGNMLKGVFAAQSGMNDYRLIHRAEGGKRFSPWMAAERHRMTVEHIKDALSKNYNGPTVIVTHMAPSARSIPSGYRDSDLNPAYASNLDELVAASGAKLWIHGHTHTSFDYRIGGTRVVCNPRGYFPDDPNPHFNYDLVVEV